MKNTISTDKNTYDISINIDNFNYIDGNFPIDITVNFLMNDIYQKFNIGYKLSEISPIDDTIEIPILTNNEPLPINGYVKLQDVQVWLNKQPVDIKASLTIQSNVVIVTINNVTPLIKILNELFI